MFNIYDQLTARLRAAGEYAWPLALRAILFWEFWEAGISKYRGENWFAQIPWADWQKGFPWPFELLGTELNWLAATWGEMVFALLLLFGLFTRFAAVSLLIVTGVATAAVHWPAQWGSLAELWQGYTISVQTAGNFKLPLLFVVMLLPLVFHGGGKISLDHLLLTITGRSKKAIYRTGDRVSAALLFAVLGLATVFVEPAWGTGLFLLAGLFGVASLFRR